MISAQVKAAKIVVLICQCYHPLSCLDDSSPILRRFPVSYSCLGTVYRWHFSSVTVYGGVTMHSHPSASSWSCSSKPLKPAYHLYLAFREPVIEVVAQHSISSWHAPFMDDHTPTPNAQLPSFLGVLQPHKDFFIPRDVIALLVHRKLPSFFFIRKIAFPRLRFKSQP